MNVKTIKTIALVSVASAMLVTFAACNRGDGKETAAQTEAQDGKEKIADKSANEVFQIDEALQILVNEIHEKINPLRGRNSVAVEPFAFKESEDAQIGTYLASRLTDNLVNIQNKRYSVLATGTHSNPVLRVTGELTLSGSNIAVNSRVLRANSGEIIGSFNVTFLRNEQVNELLPQASAPQGGANTAPDSYEPDSESNPVQVTLGTTRANAAIIERTLTHADHDFFLIVANRAGRLTMETVSRDGIDTYMHLYNASGTEIATNDDGGEGVNARISRIVRSGERYMARVRGLSDDVVGAYGFRAFIPTVAPGANSFENPTPLELGSNLGAASVVRNTLGAGGEAYYLITPRIDGPFAVLTTGAEFDSYIELYDAQGNLIAEDDDGGEGTNARVRYVGRANARYIALVRGLTDDASGSYGVLAHEIEMPKPDQYEPDDSREEADVITVGESQRRTFHTASDEDWVILEVQRTGIYLINAAGDDPNRLDTYLEIYNAAGIKIGEDDDGGEGLSALVRIQLSDNTHYYIKVRTLTSEPEHGYTLSVTAE